MSGERARIRVLIADDSAFVRKVLREILESAPDIEVVGIAHDGLEALEKVQDLRPDVLTLDLRMPDLDGVGALRALPREGGPRVVVVTTSEAQSDAALEALEAGAVDVVQKPTALASDRLYEVSARLIEVVRAAASARPRPLEWRAARAPAEARRPAPASPRPPGRARLLVIGGSTGGPQALNRVLRALPGDLPVPVAAVIHMPAGFTAGLAARLDAASALRVVEASEGLVLAPGLVAIAPGGLHLRVRDEGGVLRARLATEPPMLHRPSVDVLFASAAALPGAAAALGVVLTGMGDDGVAGARAIRGSGGEVIAEAESSCVVWGMPRAVAEAGLAAAQLPVDEIAAEVVRRL